MKAAMHYPMVSISIEREEIEMATMFPRKVPDQSWRHVDKKGHGHFWKGKNLPTLEWVVTGATWVGDEYEADEVETGEYRCRICGEVIKPGETVSYDNDRAFMPPLFTIEIGAERFVVREDGYIRSLDAWRDALREIQNER